MGNSGLRLRTVSGLLLLIVVSVLSACTEDSALLGIKKDVQRIGLYYKEFDIPVRTIQADSLRSDNVRIFIDEPVQVNLDRLMTGNTNDPIFGQINTALYTQFMTPLTKARLVRQNVTLDKVTLTLMHDYYFYGDTTVISDHTFEVKKIFRQGIDRDLNYFTKSEVSLFSTPIGQATWTFNPDSIQKHIKLNNDKNTNNNVFDSLYFELDRAYGQQLLDSVLVIKDTIDIAEADKFQQAFRGLGVIPTSSNLVMGFNPGNFKSRVTVYYFYLENGQQKRGKYVFILGSPYAASYTSINYNRAGTSLTGVTNKYTDYDVPDGYTYIQSGTGLFAKLDMSDFYSYFDTIKSPLLNSVELIVPTPAASARNHFSKPANLYYQFLGNNNRFYRPVRLETREDGLLIEKIDAQFQLTYHAELGENFTAYARGDDNSGLRIPFTETTDGTFYRAFLTEYFQYQLNLPIIYPPFKYAALYPSDAPYGKSLNGISFPSNQVKLRVYYSKPLLK